MVPGCATAKETHGATIDNLFRIKSRSAVHLTAKSKLGVLVGAHDAGFGLTQARQNFLRIVSDG
jgi:hypothetical protein